MRKITKNFQIGLLDKENMTLEELLEFEKMKGLYLDIPSLRSLRDDLKEGFSIFVSYFKKR